MGHKLIRSGLLCAFLSKSAERIYGLQMFLRRAQHTGRMSVPSQVNGISSPKSKHPNMFTCKSLMNFSTLWLYDAWSYVKSHLLSYRSPILKMGYSQMRCTSNAMWRKSNEKLDNLHNSILLAFIIIAVCIAVSRQCFVFNPNIVDIIENRSMRHVKTFSIFKWFLHFCVRRLF